MTTTRMPGHTHEVCPACGADEELCAGLIAFTMKPVPEGGHPPEKVRELYGEGLCYSKVIGIEYAYDHPRHYDGVSEWLYPCCGARFDRFTGERIEVPEDV